MNRFSNEELKAAQTAILSNIRKNEKVRDTLSQKQHPRMSQINMVTQRLRVFNLSSSLIAAELNEAEPKDCSAKDLEEAVLILPPLIRLVEDMLPKFKQGTSQHTLAVRRIKAFQIALALAEAKQEQGEEA